MDFLEIYARAGIIILTLVTLIWLASLLLKNASIMDIFWGIGFVTLTCVYFAQTPGGFEGRKWLMSTLVTIWGLRLAIHIFLRNLGKGEDFRYRKWRDEANRNWWLQSLIKVFLLQGFILWVISSPLLAAQISPIPDHLIWLDYLGLILWIIGFLFEAVSDWQLSRFRQNQDNHSKLLSTGLWQYSRHPNYFGEALLWWGFFLFAAAVGGYWTIFSPILMTILLVKVSGVSLLEKSLSQTKDGYLEYQNSTSAFLPWFPRKNEKKELARVQ